jgi:predicted RNase H-like HicB family nuclease
MRPEVVEVIMRRFYTALIEQDVDDKPDDGYGVLFPDFPGCVTTGETIQEAAAMAEEALSLHIEGMLEDSEPIPEPSPPDAPLPEWLVDTPGKTIARVLIPVEVPGRSVRINVSLDQGLLARLDRAAAASGETRSGLIARAVREVIAR